ncbi:MAG: hypothetical protein ABIX28_24395 [Vicinamibacterales bacterium]
MSHDSHPRSSEPVDRSAQENPGELLFRNNLATVEWAIRFVCQKHGLSPEEAEEFSSHVRLKLMENGYAVLCKFRGDSKLATFLVSTISYRCHDYRNARWGKWRPSAKAVRLGGHAPLIEQLTHRDDHRDDEAFEILRTNQRVVITRAEFEAILAQLPSFLNDLSAAYLARAATNGNPDDGQRALQAADQALVVNAAMPEALFNRARALEALDRADDARRAWQAYLQVDRESPWAREAADHCRC